MEFETENVLLVEDNPGDADLVRLRLVESERSVHVNCVPRLSDALKALAIETPSLVLLDLNLPDSHGAETFRRVMEKAPNVPVVILSGQDDVGLAMKAVHQGVQDYLVKGDITSKHLERALRYAVERQGLLRSLDLARKQQLEFKNQFLSHVSHELRTPLTCIHQYVTLLLDGLAGPMPLEQADHLRTILKSVRQLHAMIRDLLEATRAETGKLRVEPRCISIGDLIEQAVTMLHPLAAEKHTRLEACVDAGIPLVYADPNRILEVLINLIDNAIKFTPPEGSVVAKASMVETDPTAVYVSVCDTGRGVSPEALPRLFERLYQDPNAVDDNRSGLGLGLYIAREIISLHGGRMWAASEPGNGSTFSFHLPLYSLSRLLSPVLISEGKMRESVVLVRVDLTPLSSPPLGNWKETCEQVRELLGRCVYVDKDLVLPPMVGSGSEETFFVAASTDMQRVGIMMRRIREQLNTLPQLRSSGTLRVGAQPVPLDPAAQIRTLEQQVRDVADRITDMIFTNLGRSQNLAKENENNGNRVVH